MNAAVSDLGGGPGQLGTTMSQLQRLCKYDADEGVLRPFRHNDKTYITLNEDTPAEKNVLITNAPAFLSKQAWVDFDEAVVRVMRDELRVWGDLIAEGLVRRVPNALAKPILQYATRTDAGNATMSMDGLRKAETDRALTDLASIPLPITHGDLTFSYRDVLVSKNTQMPLDTDMIEQTTRKCAELVEQMTLGTASSYSYAGGTIYGLTNHPSRNTVTITAPTDAAWTPQLLFAEINAAIQTLADDNHRGPYGIYFSRPWVQYLNDDYSQVLKDGSTVNRLREVEDVKWIRKVDYLTGFQILVINLNSQVVRALDGFSFRTVQWEGHGGMELNFKIMGIMVPQVRVDASGNSGIVHLSA